MINYVKTEIAIKVFDVPYLIHPDISTCRLLKKFRQCGTGGYLPFLSIGACAFTSLDFNRAFSRGTQTLQQWINNVPQFEGPAPERFSKTIAWLFSVTSAFALRQQIRFINPGSILTDPLFLPFRPDFANPPDEVYDKVLGSYHVHLKDPPLGIQARNADHEDFIQLLETRLNNFFRTVRPLFFRQEAIPAQEGVPARKEVPQSIIRRDNYELYCMYLNFDIAKEGRHLSGHCSAITIKRILGAAPEYQSLRQMARGAPSPIDAGSSEPSREGGGEFNIDDREHRFDRYEIHFMDPNFGVMIINNLNQLGNALRLVFTTLYKDFGISNCGLFVQTPFWETSDHDVTDAIHERNSIHTAGVRESYLRETQNHRREFERIAREAAEMPLLEFEGEL